MHNYLHIKTYISNIKIQQIIDILLNLITTSMLEEINTSNLIYYLRKGDERAIRFLFETYYIELCLLAKGILNDDFSAQCIVSDLIYHLWENRDSLKKDIELHSYMYKAVKNNCINQLNKNYIKQEYSISGLINNNVTPSDIYFICKDTPYTELENKEILVKIRQAIDSLPQECRTIFELNRYDGLKYEEIAQKQGISINTVKYHLKQAIKKIREQLTDYLTCLLILFNIKC